MVTSIAVTYCASELDSTMAVRLVVFDEQVVVVAGQNEVDGAALEDLIILAAVGMHDRDHDVGALAPQRSLPADLIVSTVEVNCRSSGLDERGESSAVAPVRPMLHAVDGQDRPIADAGQRQPVRAAQVGGVDAGRSPRAMR